MSAMPALPLPEHDAESRPGAIWLVPRQAVRAEPVGAQPTRPQPPRPAAVVSPAVRSQAASVEAARGVSPRVQAARPNAAAAPLRLTKRGRVIVAAAVAALLVTLLSLLAAGAAQATSHSVPPQVADRNLIQVVVQPGQSLWSVAENADPNADPRQVMQQIIELNGLTGDVIIIGQRLWVPRG
jgi:LysM domain